MHHGSVTSLSFLLFYLQIRIFHIAIRYNKTETGIIGHYLYINYIHYWLTLMQKFVSTCRWWMKLTEFWIWTLNKK